MKTIFLILIIIGFIGPSFAQESIDPSLYRDAQKGETLSNPEIAIFIESLGAILIVLFIILFAIKKNIFIHNHNFI